VLDGKYKMGIDDSRVGLKKEMKKVFRRPSDPKTIA
jgi:hypothetical protein